MSGATYESAIASQGFSFDGVNDGVTAADDNALNLATTNDTVTVEAWIKPLTNTTNYGVMSVIGKRYTPNAYTTIGYEMFVLNGAPGFQIMNLSGVATFVATNHLRDGSYHHVAATLDRSSTNGGKIYVDGIPVLTFNPTVLSGSLSNNAPVRIGVHPQPGFNGWYKGIIDEATIYRRALSGTEITALYAAGSAGKCKTDTDGDGLTDVQENFLGTNANDSDTDDDGLTDGDEVFVHHTKPNDADTDDDGLPDGWEWNHFGSFGQNASGDFDLDGLNNGLEYTNSTDPNTIDFTIAVTNQYTSASNVPLVLSVLRGTASSIAVMVDSTNFPSATWAGFTSNKTANLGSGEGWHQIWVGLRGRLQTSQQTWKRKRVKLDLTPALLVVTNPAASTVSRPILQVQGYSPEPLAAFSCDLTNALGLDSNRLALVLNQRYNTNTMEFTTNYFQCFDVPLTNGLNTLTLRAKDLAGNVTVTNVSFTLDYSNKTNPPAIKVDWPRNNMRISGTNFTARGWVDDPTAQVVAEIVADTGVTNIVNGRVGRDGDFWIDHVPLAAGTNLLILIATDVVSNCRSTNVNVIKSGLTLTIEAAALGEPASGGLSDTNYTVWINGVRATNQTNGTWAATSPRLNLGHSVVQVRAIPNTDNGGNGSGSPSPEDQGNPNSTQAVDAETELVWPAGYIYADTLYRSDYYTFWRTNETVQDFWHYNLNWEEFAGGTALEKWAALLTGPPTNVVETTWDAGRLPVADGERISSIYWDAFGPYVTTNAIDFFPDPPPNPPFLSGELEFKSPLDPEDGWVTEHYTDETQLMMVTGGGSGSTGIELYGISGEGWAVGPPNYEISPYPTYTLIPPEQITIGNLGNFATNGFLLVAAATRTPKVNVTPRAPAGCGNYFSMTIGGQLYRLNWRTVSLTPTNRARTTVGVGEEVEFYFSPTLPVKVDWSTTAGSVWPTNEVYTRFTAPSNAATATVTLTYGRPVTNVTFTVIEPTGIHHADFMEYWPYSTTTIAGAGMRLRPYIGPTNVSFYRVQVMEVGEDATAVSGYFTNHTPPSHIGSGADVWITPIGQDNSWPASYDWARSTGWPSPWSDGGYTWIIPALWRVGNGPTNSMTGWNQVHTIYANGTMTVTKFGHTVSRTIQGVYSHSP